jgi:hypothetical protein
LIREHELFGNLQAEHQPVEDFLAPGEQLDRLRGLGIRVAVDDVGWPGRASATSRPTSRSRLP